MTVKHTIAQLQLMNDRCPHVIMKSDGVVVGYALSMLPSFADMIHQLIPMFRTIDQLSYQGKALQDATYIVVGQICISRGFRGKGLFSPLYHAFRRFNDNFDFCLTEIDTANARSLSAHRKVGFEDLSDHLDEAGKTWRIVIWDWNSK